MSGLPPATDVPRVTVTHLALASPGALRPARDPGGAALEKVHDPALNARLYREVGAPYAWTDRLPWTGAEWAAWSARVHTVVLRVDGVAAGFYELDPQADGDVEIAILGVLGHVHGRGFGGLLLTDAARRAWTLPGTRRVWVHTCTLDGPYALANYRARGFEPFKVETPD